MTSPPPPGLWDEPCALEGLNHQLLYGQYKYCVYCRVRNPNPPPSPVVRASLMVPTITARAALVSSAARLSNRSSSFASQPQLSLPTSRGSMPPPRRPAQRFGNLPNVAENHRRQGFKTNLPPSYNAGSKALSYRPPLTPTTPDSAQAKGNRTEPNKRHSV